MTKIKGDTIIMTVQEEVVEKLIQKNYTISFAESCTGGLCCARLVNVTGTSQVLNESFITYANEAKVKYLFVKEETIEKYGVVSEEVAYQMAEGVCRQSGANVGVGITGVAGPGGGTEKKPVGMVCFGFCIDGETTVCTAQFSDIGRNNIRNKSVEFVYEKLNELLEKK